jgi:crotonobetainyl-CoA:carnitine CoA-transferase CaiB-like acyl-CoA transferase
VGEQLARLEGVWSPLKSPAEVVEDLQALANGFVTPVEYRDGGSHLASVSPAHFDGRPIGPLKAAPNHGEDTTDMMRELGLGDDQITGLRERGTVY